MIAIDLGDKRAGIALLIEGVVMPHEIVSRVELVRYLKKTLKERKIETIVIGLPYDLYNKDTKQLDKTKKFIKKLEDIFPDKKIAGHDERYTTFEAEQILEKNGNKNKNTYKDDISAALILESYIQKHGAH